MTTTSTISCEFRFTGLVAFVAPIGFRTSRQADSLDVLLVDASRSTTRLPVHTPTLEIPEAAISSGPASDPQPAGFAFRHPPSRVWLLAGMQVSIERPAGTPNSGVRGVQNATGVSQPTGSQWHDLKWVPNLETVRGAGNGRIADSSAGGPNPLVSAELSLTSGSLEGRPPLISGFDSVECAFVPPVVTGGVVPVARQFLTDHVVFVTDYASSLTIVLTPRAGGQPRRVVLKPMAAPIVIEVCNENTTGAVAINDSTHFAAFYDLIDPTLAPAQKLVPQPMGVTSQSADGPPGVLPAGISLRPAIGCPGWVQKRRVGKESIMMSTVWRPATVAVLVLVAFSAPAHTQAQWTGLMLANPNKGALALAGGPASGACTNSQQNMLPSFGVKSADRSNLAADCPEELAVFRKGAAMELLASPSSGPTGALPKTARRLAEIRFVILAECFDGRGQQEKPLLLREGTSTVRKPSVQRAALGDYFSSSDDFRVVHESHWRSRCRRFESGLRRCLQPCSVADDLSDIAHDRHGLLRRRHLWTNSVDVSQRRDDHHVGHSLTRYFGSRVWACALPYSFALQPHRRLGPVRQPEPHDWRRPQGRHADAWAELSVQSGRPVDSEPAATIASVATMRRQHYRPLSSDTARSRETEIARRTMLSNRRNTSLSWLPAFVLVGAVCGVGCTVSGSQEPPPKLGRAEVNEWLTCTECTSGELKNVLALGNGAVQDLDAGL